MPIVTPDVALVARCGLYCGACKAYLGSKCPGCHANARATWCTVRACCLERGIATCAECTDFDDPRKCRKFDNAMSKLFGILFRSDRAACVDQIRREGLAGHAAIMAERGAHTIRRGSRDSRSCHS